MFTGKTHAEWLTIAENAKELADHAEQQVQPAPTEADREHWLRMASYWWTVAADAEDAACQAAIAFNRETAATQNLVADMERDGLL